ncbi:VOC family protein [Dongia sedimenti]|uniref:VOC family protein n=1 Tax=Dongia sedimenti TaxID=3064282 RepID=A0ABU0YH99_9PROT|nr:VOC family protein [Rhodospirillaceae bacterium R-7]
MHKSRLAGFTIDCKTGDLDAAADFWSAALGLKRSAADTPAKTTYVYPQDPDPNAIHIETQTVAHESRVHLDIESDDIEAEAARLEKLGARRIDKIQTWMVMEAPTGQRFCIVRPQRANFDKEANVWE